MWSKRIDGGKIDEVMRKFVFPRRAYLALPAIRE
jgi:hypothetical protein